MGNQYKDEMKLDIPIQSDSVDKMKLRNGERVKHNYYGAQVISSSLTPNNSTVYTINNSHTRAIKRISSLK